MVFKKGRIDTHDKERNERPSIISEKPMQESKKKIHNICRVTLKSLTYRHFLIHFITFLRDIVIKRLG